MRFTKGLKKFLSLALTSALVVTGANVVPGLQEQTAKTAKAASSNLVVFDGEVSWNTGENKDCRLEIYNNWGSTKEVTDGVLDTEFTELSKHGELISIGLVDEDNNESDAVYNRPYQKEKFVSEFEQQPLDESQITCPYCHSTNVQKITMGKKVVKGWLWGAAAASTLTKEWHCNNCKSNF